MKTPLVSIIVTFFEAESYALQQMQSLKNISYENIQFIIVVGCSDDLTDSIVDRQIAELENGGTNVKKIVVSGKITPSRLLNRGLKEVEGEYFLQTDGDDFLESTSISKMVAAFKNAPCGLVQGFAKDFDMETGTFLRHQQIDMGKNNTLLDILCGQNVIFNPGTRLIKTDVFKSFYPSMEIYESDEGQNWQVVIPFFLKGEYKFLPEPVLHVSKRVNSHSLQRRSLKEAIQRINEFECIWRESIKTTGYMTDYHADISEAYAHHGFVVGCQFKNYDFAKKFFSQLNSPSVTQRIKLIRLKLGI